MTDTTEPGTPYAYDDAMLCANCLSRGAAKVRVGGSTGTQRDPTNRHVVLCQRCATALVCGDFGALTAAFTSERRITQ